VNFTLVLIAAAAFLTSLALTPLVRRWCLRNGRVYRPRQDRWHTRSTASLGGVAMFAAFTLAALAYTAAASAWDQVPWGLLAGVGLMFALGLVDDFRHLKPPTKLVIQFTAAAITISFGYVIDFFPWTLANVILTFSWLVGISNAINLLDNMDGLAGGIALIAASFLAYFFWLGGSQILLALTLALVGSIMGFLIYNFPPAKIFMGDSGSIFL
jgi:UDP-GlcNAc:undecaprenyl-phosphate/decaprenyl-phosphate GlcNAc-1-phosphate transferase